MRLLRKKPAAPAAGDSPNPSLERGPKEQCLATWWTQLTPGTSYWRCVVPARHLPGQALNFSLKDLAVDEEDNVIYPRQRGVAIWQFLGDAIRSRAAIGQRTLYGTKTLMECDDDYTRRAAYAKKMGWYGRPGAWVDTVDEAGLGYSNEGNRYLATIVDGIICSTERLADVYSDYNANVHLCPNSIDPDDWQYPRTESDKLRIVYYGSGSHRMDAPLVTKALKWASRQSHVEIWTVGFKHWAFAQDVPWTDSLEDARRSLFKFDLGLAPLARNPWANAKSDVKILEYGMAGVLPLMSRAKPFSYWDDHAPDLVLDDGDWADAIRWAVKNPDEVRARAAEIKAHILEHRTIHQSIHLWRQAIDA